VIGVKKFQIVAKEETCARWKVTVILRNEQTRQKREVKDHRPVSGNCTYTLKRPGENVVQYV